MYPNSTALVVSTENITQNWYFGNDRSMLIPNCLFRVGGAAMLLSNKRSDRRRAKCAPRLPGRLLFSFVIYVTSQALHALQEMVLDGGASAGCPPGFSFLHLLVYG